MVHELVRTPRARRHDDNQRRILEAAMGMVEREGFAGLSLHKLAAAVDYTPGALYRYFGSKDALYAQLVVLALADARAHLERGRARLPADASPLAAVLADARAYREFARATPERFGLLATTLADPRVLVEDDGAAEPIIASMMATLQGVASALSAATEGGALSAGDPIERTLCLFGLAQGVLQMEKQASRAAGVIDTERLLLSGVRALLVGWGASPEAVDAAARQALPAPRGLAAAASAIPSRNAGVLPKAARPSKARKTPRTGESRR
ncbi:MAG TPA: TetR/AcrR family transcriptional regulator [Polyangiaceae bacterium]|nr:TetR/AcrR family transcriptional regulator [Polyangiaceae bacterium]